MRDFDYVPITYCILDTSVPKHHYRAFHASPFSRSEQSNLYFTVDADFHTINRIMDIRQQIFNARVSIAIAGDSMRPRIEGFIEDLESSERTCLKVLHRYKIQNRSHKNW